MPEQFEVENEGIVIPAQIVWLANPCNRRERRQNGEITVSSVVFLILGSKVAQSLLSKDIKLAGVSYRVAMYPNEVLDSRCELWCAWGHIESQCGSKHNVATAQAITGPATTSAILQDALQISDHSAATRWRSALIVKQITSHSVAGA
jgi:hypothetical protein